MAAKKITITDVFEALMANLRTMSRPIWLDHSDNNIRVKIMSTISRMTTLDTVTNVAQVGGFNANTTLVYSVDRINWANNIRSKIN